MGAVTLALTGCAGGGKAAQSGETKAELPFKACAVSDTGGWQDKSFNESAYDGLMEAKSYLGVTVDTPSPTQRMTSSATLTSWWPAIAR